MSCGVFCFALNPLWCVVMARFGCGGGSERWQACILEGEGRAVGDLVRGKQSVTCWGCMVSYRSHFWRWRRAVCCSVKTCSYSSSKSLTVAASRAGSFSSPSPVSEKIQVTFTTRVNQPESNRTGFHLNHQATAFFKRRGLVVKAETRLVWFRLVHMCGECTFIFSSSHHERKQTSSSLLARPFRIEAISLLVLGRFCVSTLGYCRGSLTVRLRKTAGRTWCSSPWEGWLLLLL